MSIETLEQLVEQTTTMAFAREAADWLSPAGVADHVVRSRHERAQICLSRHW